VVARADSRNFGCARGTGGDAVLSFWYLNSLGSGRVCLRAANARFFAAAALALASEWSKVMEGLGGSLEGDREGLEGYFYTVVTNAQPAVVVGLFLSL
jgi:hypothetical protein